MAAVGYVLRILACRWQTAARLMVHRKAAAAALDDSEVEALGVEVEAAASGGDLRVHMAEGHCVGLLATVRDEEAGLASEVALESEVVPDVEG